MAFDQNPPSDADQDPSDSEATPLEIDDGAIKRLLDELITAEQSKKSASLNTGLDIQNCLGDPTNRGLLIEVLDQYDEREKSSQLLVYLKVLTHALAGKLDSARAISDEWLVYALLQHGADSEQFLFASRLSRALDFFVRDGIEFDDRERLHFEAFQSCINSSSPHSSVAKFRLFRRENISAIEQERKFIKALLETFNEAVNLEEKLRITQEALNAWHRKDASGAVKFELVHEFYSEMRPSWVRLIQDAFFDWKPPEITAVVIVENLVRVHRLAEALGERYDAGVIQNALVDIAATKWGDECCSTVASLLIEKDPSRLAGLAKVLAVRTNPQTASEAALWHYFNWALHANEYEIAAAFLSKIPSQKGRPHWVRLFAQLAARNQDFELAACEADTLHASNLCQPFKLNPLVALDNFLTHVDCRFLLHLKGCFERNPQFESPTGVVFLTDRSVSDVSRLPLERLIELRDLGWALVPLVAGTFPTSSTGIPVIDDLAGRLDQNFRVLTEAASSCDGPGKDDSEAEHQIHQSPGAKVFIGAEEWATVDVAARDRSVDAIQREAARKRLTQYRFQPSGGAVSTDPICPLHSRRLDEDSETLVCFERAISLLEEKRAGTDMKFVFLCSSGRNWIAHAAHAHCKQVDEPSRIFAVTSELTKIEIFRELPFLYETGGGFSRAEVSPELVKPRPTRSEVNQREPGSFRERERERFSAALREFEHPRPESDISNPARLVKQMISNWRKTRGRVVCLFLPAEHRIGNCASSDGVFGSTEEWVRDSIRFTEQSETLLLVWPDSTRHDEFGVLCNQPSNLLLGDKKLSENTVILDPRWFNLVDLVEDIDLGVSIDGAIALELTLLGVPQQHVCVPELEGLDLKNLVIGSKRKYKNLLSSNGKISDASPGAEKVKDWCYKVISDDRLRENNQLRPPLDYLEKLTDLMHRESINASSVIAEQTIRIFGRHNHG